MELLEQLEARVAELLARLDRLRAENTRLRAETSAIVAEKAVLEEELPMLRHFAGGPHSGSDASLRSMLTMRNPMFSFPQELVDRIEKRLLALN